MWIACCFVGGCTTAAPVTITDQDPYLSGADIEARELPVSPKDEDLPADLPDTSEWAEPCDLRPLDDYPVCSRPGILISEAKAARIELYRLRYEELRKSYEADRSTWRAHRDLYEAQIRLDERRIQELTPPRPSWWDLHGQSVVISGALAVGVVAGATLTVGVGYALYGTQISP